MLFFNQFIGTSELSIDNEATKEEIVGYTGGNRNNKLRGLCRRTMVFYLDGYTFMIKADGMEKSQLVKLADSIEKEKK